MNQWWSVWNFADDPLDRSMLADIEVKITKWGKRNAVSRVFRAKNDRETIAGWKSDLTKVLLIFNVSSLVFVWLSLTVYSQTELAINTNVTVATTHTIVSDVRNDVAITHAIVSDIHRAVTGGQQGAGGNDQSVSFTCTPFITE